VTLTVPTEATREQRTWRMSCERGSTRHQCQLQLWLLVLCWEGIRCQHTTSCYRSSSTGDSLPSGHHQVGAPAAGCSWVVSQPVGHLLAATLIGLKPLVLEASVAAPLAAAASCTG